MTKKKIAVLLTCHNRKEKTLACLHGLTSMMIESEYTYDIFLVDDGSTDGTGDVVREEFPIVNVIQGTGELYWNQGMRLAWDVASKGQNFDFYLWLNDDTLLFPNGFSELLDSYNIGLKENGKPVIVTGACCLSFEDHTFSYGGRTIDDRPVIPNGSLQNCKFINGNAVLIPMCIFEVLGNLSNKYTHGRGDLDYGLRAERAGFKCLTAKEYVGVCPRNEGVPDWCNPKLSIFKRWKLMYSPVGLNIKEYNYFNKTYIGNKWFLLAFKAYIKMVFPLFYSHLRKQ